VIHIGTGIIKTGDVVIWWGWFEGCLYDDGKKYQLNKEKNNGADYFALMGADVPIPPNAMNPAAPDGAPPRLFSRFSLLEKISSCSLGLFYTSCLSPRCPGLPHYCDILNKVDEKPPKNRGHPPNAVKNMKLNKMFTLTKYS
jgi:hypothetical protein